MSADITDRNYAHPISLMSKEALKPQPQARRKKRAASYHAAMQQIVAETP
jgi:hypothetical protein